MTHDPLCPYRPETLGMGGTAGAVLNYRPEVPCLCDLIAKVRADTLDKAESEIDSWRNDDDPEEYIKGNIDAIGAIRNLRNAS